MKNEKSKDMKLETHYKNTLQQDVFFIFSSGSLKPSYFCILSKLLWVDLSQNYHFGVAYTWEPFRRIKLVIDMILIFYEKIIFIRRQTCFDENISQLQISAPKER